MKSCIVEWCNAKSESRIGYCGRHYQQMKKWGEVRWSKGDKNEIIKYDNCAEIILYDKQLNEKARAVIDLDDVEKCKSYKWVYRNDGYVSSRTGGKGIKLHRFIANTPKGMHTDHINRNRLDNRKCNLRICSQSENNLNKSAYKNNTSGRRGVKHKNGRYEAVIKYNKEKYYLGFFTNFDDAVKAREEAELKIYGHILEDM